MGRFIHFSSERYELVLVGSTLPKNSVCTDINVKLHKAASGTGEYYGLT